WLAEASQLESDPRILASCSFIHIQNPAVENQTFQPALISRLVTRLRNAIPIFTYSQNRKRHFIGMCEDRNHGWIMIRNRRDRIRIQDQRHISGSMCSKAPSMTSLIRSVSWCRSFSLPTCFIQGFWPLPEDACNFSSTASV